jgi:hypothetical protein
LARNFRPLGFLPFPDTRRKPRRVGQRSHVVGHAGEIQHPLAKLRECLNLGPVVVVWIDDMPVVLQHQSMKICPSEVIRIEQGEQSRCLPMQELCLPMQSRAIE